MVEAIFRPVVVMSDQCYLCLSLLIKAHLFRCYSVEVSQKRRFRVLLIILVFKC